MSWTIFPAWRKLTRRSNRCPVGKHQDLMEVYKGGPVMLQKLTQLFQSIWNEDKVPQQFREASIVLVHIYRRKGNRQSCDNHRGISLLSKHCW